jgi:hypothetical protein
LVKKQLLADGDVISIDENEFIYEDLREYDDEEKDGEDTKAG